MPVVLHTQVQKKHQPPAPPPAPPPYLDTSRSPHKRHHHRWPQDGSPPTTTYPQARLRGGNPPGIILDGREPRPLRCIHVDPSSVDAAPPPPPAVPIVRDGVDADHHRIGPLRQEEDARSKLFQQKGGGGRTAQAGEGVREGGAVRRRHTAVHVHPRGPHEDIAGQEQGHTEEHPPVVLPGSEDRGRRPERVREGTSSRQFIAAGHSFFVEKKSL